MPKKSEGTGATYAGHTGIVQDANQKLWEVNPELDVDGKLIPGEHPDLEENEDIIKAREAGVTADHSPQTVEESQLDAGGQEGNGEESDNASERGSEGKALPSGSVDTEKSDPSDTKGGKSEEEDSSSPGISSSTRSDSKPSSTTKTGSKK